MFHTTSDNKEHEKFLSPDHFLSSESIIRLLNFYDCWNKIDYKMSIIDGCPELWSCDLVSPLHWSCDLVSLLHWSCDLASLLHWSCDLVSLLHWSCNLASPSMTYHNYFYFFTIKKLLQKWQKQNVIKLVKTSQFWRYERSVYLLIWIQFFNNIYKL